MIDYAVLKVLWWGLIGCLFAGFAIMDGKIMGIGAILPFLGKTDVERRCMINAAAPHWTGDAGWFITSCGALVAIWPLVCATAFSSFYWAMLVLLLAFILRPAAIVFRSKLPSPKWSTFWDWTFFIGSALPPVICGMLFGNLLQGVPFHFDETLRPIYTGSFFGLLNPFSLLCAATALFLMISLGANYLVLRTDSELQRRAVSISALSSLAAIVLFLAGGLWVYFGIDGLVASAGLDPEGAANPLAKTVDIYAGAWFTNFKAHPTLWLVPTLAAAGLLCSIFCIRALQALAALASASVAMLAVILTPLIAMFPFVLPSSAHIRSSLTIWDCTSSQLTLEALLFAAILFLPSAIGLTIWSYQTLAGKITADFIKRNDRQLC